MKKSIAIIFLLIVAFNFSRGQVDWRDSIRYELSVVEQDTSRILLLVEFANYYKYKRPDSALLYAYQAMDASRKINFIKGEVWAMMHMVEAQITLGNDSKAFELGLQAAKAAENHKMIFERAVFLSELGSIHFRHKDYANALSVFRRSMSLSDPETDFTFSRAQQYLGEIHFMTNHLDSAIHYSQLAHDNAVKSNFRWVALSALINLGRIQSAMGNQERALKYFRQSESMSHSLESEQVFVSNISIAQFYQQTNKPDSSIHYAKKSLEIAKEGGFYSNAAHASTLLSNLYENKDPQTALEYNKMAIAYKDSIDNMMKTTAFEHFFELDEQERLREIEIAEAEFQNRLKMNAFLGISFTLAVTTFLFYRNNRIKQKAKQKIEGAYHQLKSTQKQLIQSEKMASLGELTAGIAHEIQNPLNFVNNFSELNAELFDDLEQEVDKGNLDGVKSIAKGIRENQQKINHHGKRADAIVKGMLQHSRSTSGPKELTDFNTLVDEYLRLAYHGFRAKEKSFSATLKTDFDETIGNINVIPQEIGRVILNLINNAFYAVSAKSSATTNGSYIPTVSVSTKKISDRVEVRVADNGNGISPEILNKIFQPFFTTKPTGQGTGLGLSLAYDIVKAHGGELKVDTIQGEGAVFTIQLPSS